MISQLQKRIPHEIVAALIVLFGVALLTSLNSARPGASQDLPPDADAARQLNRFDQATQAAGEGPDPRITFIPLPTASPTPTRTPTPVNIGNFVWDDLDQDGRQDAGEPGLAGVTVQLWNSTKTVLLHETVTNGSGNYTLVAQAGPGNYRVRVVLPSGLDYFTVKDSAGGDDTKDSDINPTGTNFGFTDIVSIASNVISITSIDAGIVRYKTPTPTRTPTPINLGNFVWHDLNGDGVQDVGEPGVPGVVVQLWNAAKTVRYGTVTTNASGNYTVVAPVPGDYRVQVLRPYGSSFTLKDQGSDTQDSDFNTVGVNVGYTDIIGIASNVISISSIDAGLVSVPSTPSVETLALYSKKKIMFSFVDTLQDFPPSSAYNTFASNAPEKGKFVMGDWNGNGIKTPGLLKNGMFWYTNAIGPSASWSSVLIGDYGKVYPVAGRFSGAYLNDCFGVVELDFVSAMPGFPLHSTCELGALMPPGGIQGQWLDVTLNGTTQYQFVAGDWNGDGLDSIAARRDKKVAWSDTAPSQGATAVLAMKQKLGKPNGDVKGQVVAGDWNGDGIDSFGLFFKDGGLFYWRDDLAKDKLPFNLQHVGRPVGGKAFAASWRDTNILRDAGPVLLPPPAVDDPAPFATSTPGPVVTPMPLIEQPSLTPTLTPTPSYFPTAIPTSANTIPPLVGIEETPTGTTQ